MPSNKITAFVHFVWATWNREEIITPEIERPLYRYIERVCRDHGSDVLAIGGMPDHAHLLVTLPGTRTFAALMRDVKGGSSRFVTVELEQGEWFEWQGGYGAFKVSPAHKDTVIAYNRNQRRRHAGGSLCWHAEESAIEPKLLSAKADAQPQPP